MNQYFIEEYITMINQMSQCFSLTNFNYFKSYVMLILMCSNGKCISTIKSACFFFKRNISSWTRFISRSEWDFRRITKILIDIIIKNFKELLIIHGKGLVVVDTTLIAKQGKKMISIQKWHDHSSNADRGSSILGHHWGILGLICYTPIRYICFPLITRLISGKKNIEQWISGPEGVRPMNFWDCTLSLIYEFQIYIGIDFRVVADSYFCKSVFINPLINRGIDVVTKMRKDAVGWLDVEKKSKGRGRPRKKGKKIQLRFLNKFCLPEEIFPVIYGKSTGLIAYTIDIWIRDVDRKVRVVMIENDGNNFILLSTDLSLSATQIIEIYGSRFSIEICIRDLKQHFGFASYQCYTPISIIRISRLACISMSIWLTIMLKDIFNESKDLLFGKSNSIYKAKTVISFTLLKKSIKHFIIKKIYFDNSASNADFKKLKSGLDDILKIAS